MPGPFAEAADALEQEVTDHTTEISHLSDRLTELEGRVSRLESGTTEPIPPEPPTEPPGELIWINIAPDSHVTIAATDCVTESDRDRADAFCMTENGENVRVRVKTGDEANVGRGRSEFRTDDYIDDSWHVEFEVVVGASLPSGSNNYNVHSQYHPNNDTENPSASINYQVGKFQVQTSEGSGSTIKDRGYVTAKAGDRIKVIWDAIFGGNSTGHLRCDLTNLTTGEHKLVELHNVSLGKAGRLHNFKAGTYRQVAASDYEATYYGLRISHPAQNLDAVV